jgi:hypothetical protein
MTFQRLAPTNQVLLAECVNVLENLMPSFLGGFGHSEVIPRVEPYVKLLAHRPSVTVASKYEGIGPQSSTVT